MDAQPWILLEMRHFRWFLRVGAETLLAVREGLSSQTQWPDRAEWTRACDL
jgi:hypothetical protein